MGIGSREGSALGPQGPGVRRSALESAELPARELRHLG